MKDKFNNFDLLESIKTSIFQQRKPRFKTSFYTKKLDLKNHKRPNILTESRYKYGTFKRLVSAYEVGHEKSRQLLKMPFQ